MSARGKEAAPNREGRLDEATTPGGIQGYVHIPPCTPNDVHFALLDAQEKVRFMKEILGPREPDRPLVSRRIDLSIQDSAYIEKPTEAIIASPPKAIDKPTRAMMASDLWERAAKLARDGRFDEATPVSTCAEFVIERDDPEDNYRRGLESAGLSPVAVEAAVVAVLDGKYPPDSLAGELATYEREVGITVGPRSADPHARGFTAGRISAARWFLDLLGARR